MTEVELARIKEKIKNLLKNAPEPLHAFDHALRVSENSAKIAIALGVDTEIDMNILQAAGLLHDIPKALTPTTFLKSLASHFLEASLVKNNLPQILDKLELKGKERNTIYNAILRHSLSFPYRRLNKNADLYTKIIQDADTLDLFSPQRMAKFRKYRKSLLQYKLIGGIIDWGVNYKSWFLNYPELAKHADSFYAPKEINNNA
jgi:HD superfamily phosphodiesterase